MSNSSRIIFENLTEITATVISNLGIEISRSRTNLAFPITNAQWVQLLVSFKEWYATDAYPSRDASENRCNCVSLTSTNSLSLRQQSTLTSSSLGSSSSQCFHWIFSVSSVKSSRPSLLLLGVWNNSLALMMYGVMKMSFPCSFCVTG